MPPTASNQTPEDTPATGRRQPAGRRHTAGRGDPDLGRARLQHAQRLVDRLLPAGGTRRVTVVYGRDDEAAYTRKRRIHVHPLLVTEGGAVLAGTVAHELAHIQQRDLARVTSARVALLLAATGVTVATVAGGAGFPLAVAVAGVSALAARAAAAAYQRQRELAADIGGALLLDQAGLGPGVDQVTAALSYGQRHSLASQPIDPRIDRNWMHDTLARLRRAWAMVDATHPPLAGRLARLQHTRLTSIDS